MIYGFALITIIIFTGLYFSKTNGYKWLLLFFLLLFSSIISFTKFVGPSINYFVYAITLVLLIIIFRVNISKSLIKTWPFLPFFIALIFSLLSSININRSKYFILTYLLGICWFVFFRSLIKKDEKNLEKISLSSGFLLYICIAFSIWDYLNYDSFIVFIEQILSPTAIEDYNLFHFFNRVIGIGLYPGINAALVSMLYLIAIPLFKSHKLLNTITVLLVTWVIIMSGNRGILLLWVFSLSILYIELLIKLSIVKKIVIILFTILFIILIILFSGYGSFNSEKLVGLNRLFTSENNASIDSRFSIYQEAFSMWKENKMIGIGIDNFVARAELRGGVGILSEVTQVHNIYLQILVETGILGALFFLVLLINFIVTDIRLLKNYGLNNEYTGYLLANMIFLFNGLSANPLYNSQLFLMFLLIRGIISGINKNKLSNFKPNELLLRN
ncbi:O-antigen ligase family protein [Neobacillus sp. OS1-33]|uniref:O-antigen ligase family protein n=1 Tax=Neobacillus sp. OS1-33 TaxID=3070683 RepID=UPI0027E02311|nr:O-antigen ligase family protein [Neobacillus sp. OS1-33]WML24561.1 O-antigen ligase family protein [Neobacillus sp. OS1-33]